MLSLPSQPGENGGERWGEFECRSVKTRDTVDGFHLHENSHKLCRGFEQAMEAWTTCFISFRKLLFSLLTKRKTIYKARSVNSHNSETVKPHCSRHFVLYSAMKTQTLVLSNYFIKLNDNYLKVKNTDWHEANQAAYRSAWHS